ncbi:MAG: hypothetical protein IPM21_09750 [Acidobacteria bacterium]|nr:hypothetical protein [Acidobacteriota bacterium]
MDFLTSINLITLFAIIGGIGFIFLLASLVLGDIFEMFGGEADLGGEGPDFGLFDSRVIAVFVTAFGGFGTIAAWSGYGAIASSMAGLLGGLIFGGVVSAFGRFLVSQQASSTVTDDDLIGRTAQVTVAIKPGTLGQITARVGDERVERLARASADAEIAAGSIVTIKSIAGDSVIVVPEG